MSEPVTGLITEPRFTSWHCLNRARELGFDSIEEFQQFYDRQLKVDGVPGPKTQRIMFGRRICSVPDLVRGPEAALARWPEPGMTLWHDMHDSFSTLSRDDVDWCVSSAVESLNAVCGARIKLTQDGSSANGVAHGKPIDGPGGTLAWAYLPWDGISMEHQLELRFDTREQWTRTGFRQVDMHEFGHWLGLGHSPDPKSVMYAFANGVQQWSSGDISELQARYGEPTSPPEPEPPSEVEVFGLIRVTLPGGKNIYIHPTLNPT